MGAIDIRMQNMAQDNRAHGALLQNRDQTLAAISRSYNVIQSIA